MKRFYPLKFEPILKEKIWGGEKLKTFLKKNSHKDQIGESWEISGVKGNVSVIANGELRGMSLKDVLNNYPEEILGTKINKMFGTDFPLLIKFIDAKKDLSIQLHPDDALAKERHNSFGKTEMWYVMQADKDSNLIVGFNEDMNKETYLKHLENNTLTQILNFDKVSSGDTYFIESGRVHAIGGGVLLAEIQQTSDITYRVYDWDRVDENGNERELHNDIAIDAFNFDLKDDFRINYSKNINLSNEMVSCPFFTTNFINLIGQVEKQNKHGSFVIYICVDGKCVVSNNGFNEVLEKGETLLMPAAIDNYTIEGEGAKLLEVYI
ncbi:class I mannose-6-phosphate isomerase [Winogradskyella sp. DF17]|uniref:Phosphohexomutase n=1 Tax=Winogradskyella pelagia TaxID=2819984 RepID=A0ABS3T218_9FLAO|nr:type I phosphomannose isomerase catalytic subunit [Winogradskyella sp. DF17]MBO3116790.1 class I mannose-6-phosphate isomerase [Winogradskyella sp. DF17]